METRIDLTKLRPFNLEEAKAGKPVCTRDGRPARIICFDLKDISFNLVVAVSDRHGYEYPYHYTSDGTKNIHENKIEECWDLMMLPEKNEGWVNILQKEAYPYVGNKIYDSEQEAIDAPIGLLARRIATTKIEWYE